ncbi:MAG: hypothetical protein MZV65_47015 [Chromatiales bacterium]|nr:hypothetical protein [Chromatiales bacterium]
MIEIGEPDSSVLVTVTNIDDAKKAVEKIGGYPRADPAGVHPGRYRRRHRLR